MECSEFRERIGAEPLAVDPPRDAHRAACPACRAYAERLLASEQLISAALRFDVAALKRDMERLRQPPRSRRLTLIAGAAAAALAVVAVLILVRPGAGGPLADAVADHWYHEPESWVVTEAVVSQAALMAVLRSSAQLELGGIGPLTYVRSCFFRGHWVPHLVVQGQAGPVMVLLLPHEPLSSPQTVAIPEQGLAGVIVPHGRGSVALLGHAAEPLEPLKDSFLAAVEWSI